MTPLEFRLLDDFQRGFPLVPQPYAALAETLGASEPQVIATLAAMAVPRERLAEVAHLVSSCREVNHNYEREHRYNLWFVAAAPDDERLAATLARIAQAAGIEVLSLPLVEEYHIDLGFPLGATGARGPCVPPAPGSHLRPPGVGTAPPSAGAPERAALDAAGRRLVAALEYGLPLLSRAYAALAARAGLDEGDVLERLAQWQAEGLIRRLGVIVRHHELGYRANAMAVWDVPDELAPRCGRALAASLGVTLAYRRARQLPQWPYNLYCMIHGGDRDRVAARIAALGRALGLDRFPHAVLFSRTRFKQTGARVALLAEAAHG